MRISAALRFDIQFQYRHGFHAVYLLVTVIYALFLRSLPEVAAVKLLPVILLTDPAMLGLLFIGALLLLEKESGTVQTLFVTPLRLKEYLFSRLLSLGLISWITSLAITTAVYGIRFSLILLSAGILLTAWIATLTGIALASRAANLNRFLVPAAGWITLACLPLLEHFGLFFTPLFYLFPTYAALLLLRGSIGQVSHAETIYALLSLTLWLFPAWKLAVHSFSRSILQRIGGRN